VKGGVWCAVVWQVAVQCVRVCMRGKVKWRVCRCAGANGKAYATQRRLPWQQAPRKYECAKARSKVFAHARPAPRERLSRARGSRCQRCMVREDPR